MLKNELDKTKQLTCNWPVFLISAGLILFIIVLSTVFTQEANRCFKTMQVWLTENVGWFYILVVAFIFITTICLAFSRYGNIKLGPNHASPDYTYGSWFAMLFSAGMGIGLMFFGVAEPVIHFMQPPTGSETGVQNAQEAMKICFFHWGLHAWAIYGIVALILAYFSYRHKLPLTMRSALFPLVGNRIYGALGHAVDIFAILGTVFGVATSLGYGATQVNSGMHFLFGISENKNVQLIIILVVTMLATLSVSSGLNKGVRLLSEINLLLAVGLLTFVFLLGPTSFLLKAFIQNTGAYLSDIIYKTFNLYAYESSTWIGKWTLLCWCWWLSWSPFVGMFIARISRGRTIREFLLGVLLVPAVFTLLWMTVFGNTAIDSILRNRATLLAKVAVENTPLALFVFLKQFPLANFLCLLATFMIIIFFVTSADSGTLVVNMLSSNGEDKTPIWQRIFWSAVIGLSGITLLFSGGLEALQSATIASAFPFSIILLLSIYGLMRALKVEGIKQHSIQHPMNTTPLALQGTSFPWRKRLQSLFYFPTKTKTESYLKEVALPALKEVAGELETQGAKLIFKESATKLHLEIFHGEEVDFIYGIQLRTYNRPALGIMDLKEDKMDYRKYYRADVYLHEGSQDYDVMGYSREQLIGDLLSQYEKHMHFINTLS